MWNCLIERVDFDCYKIVLVNEGNLVEVWKLVVVY